MTSVDQPDAGQRSAVSKAQRGKVFPSLPSTPPSALSQPIASTSSARPPYFRNPWSEDDVFVAAPTLSRSSSGHSVSASRIPIKSSPSRTPPVPSKMSRDTPTRLASYAAIDQLPPRKASLQAQRVVQSHGVEFEIATQPSINQVLASSGMSRGRSASAGGDVKMARVAPLTPVRKDREASLPMRRSVSGDSIVELDTDEANRANSPLTSLRTNRPPNVETTPRKKVGAGRIMGAFASPRACRAREHSVDGVTLSPTMSSPRHFNLADLPPSPPMSAGMRSRNNSIRMQANRRAIYSPSPSADSSPSTSDDETAPTSRRRRVPSHAGSAHGSARGKSSRVGTPNRSRQQSEGSATVAIEANERGSWRAVGKAIMDPVEGTTVVVRCSAPAMVETKTINTIGPDGLPCVQYEISFKPITRPFTPPPSAPKRTTLVPPRRAGQEDTSSESAPASTPRIDASSHSPSPTEEPRTPRRCNSPPLPEVDSPLAGKGKGGEGGGLGLTDLGTRLAALQPVHDDWHGYESYLADAYGSDILSLPPTPAVQPTSSPLTFAAAPAAAPHVSIVAPPVTKMSPLAKRRCGSMGARQLFLGFEGMQLTTRGPPTSMEEAELALLTTSSSVNEVSRWSETETEGTGSDTVAETPAEVTRAFFGV